jgi:hypothetical protein
VAVVCVAELSGRDGYKVGELRHVVESIQAGSVLKYSCIGQKSGVKSDSMTIRRSASERFFIYPSVIRDRMELKMPVCKFLIIAPDDFKRYSFYL